MIVLICSNLGMGMCFSSDLGVVMWLFLTCSDGFVVSGGVVDGFVVLGLWLVVFVDCGVVVVLLVCLVDRGVWGDNGWHLFENWVCIGGEWCVGLLAGGWLRKRDRFERKEKTVNFYIILLYN